MLHLIPAGLHRALYRVAYHLRAMVRRIFKVPIRGVGAVLRDHDGRILLVRHSYGAPGWSLPGGGCDRHEDPAQTVRREIREELRIEIDELESVATIGGTISGALHTSHLFAGIVNGTPQPDGREIVEAAFFACEALPAGLSAPTRSRLELWEARLAARADTDQSKGN